jgi:hypothetical protein
MLCLFLTAGGEGSACGSEAGSGRDLRGAGYDSPEAHRHVRGSASPELEPEGGRRNNRRALNHSMRKPDPRCPIFALKGRYRFVQRSQTKRCGVYLNYKLSHLISHLLNVQIFRLAAMQCLFASL